jgi:hypothetical protein
MKTFTLQGSVADPGCFPGCRIRIFSIPEPGNRVKKISGSRIRIRIKEFKYFNQKKLFLISDPDLDSLPIPDPGSRGQKGTGSQIRILNTASSMK